jgi:hypothetical protein
MRGGRQGGAQVLAADALLPDDDMPDVLNADTLLPDDDDNDTRWHSAVKAPFCLIFFIFPEGPEKTTRGGGVNGSQSKFSSRTWPISQNQLKTPLF